MLVAVQSFGSIWTARTANTNPDRTKAAQRDAYYNTTGVLAGEKLRGRSCVYGYLRLDECSGFHPRFVGRFVHRVYESDGVAVWDGRNRLFLRQLTPAGTRPDVYLFRIGTADTGWIDRSGAWMCDAAQVVSFSEVNMQQEVLVVLPPFGWVRGEQGTFCVDPQRDRPWLAALSRITR